MNIWQYITFMLFWYLSLIWVGYNWSEEISKIFFIIKLFLLMTCVSIQWMYNCGTKYYIVTYRFAEDEEGVWRVIEFPPIR